ncbi:MAG: hypothetical protein KAR35_06220 [Candidatus Heimdallarchaeota archaeon]|nr:hypothetical protein [Candidatus Heimdallarchaeota archaeon]MCK5048954.1 hypothetical protein [Candidatus Heimdallarchaeota archaeon]
MNSYLFICNPVAKGGKTKNAPERIEKYLKSLDQEIDYSILVSEWAGHSLELARDNKNDFSTIVSGGGDGTINEIINGVGINSSTLIGSLPLGTGNDASRNLGTHGSLERALDIVLNGQAVNISAGKITGEGMIPEMSSIDEVGRYYINHTLSLFAGMVSHSSLTEARWIKSGFKYTWLAIKKAFKWNNLPGRVILDDQVLEYENLVLANIGLGENVGGGMKMFPGAIPFDNQEGFNVLLASEIGTFTILRLLSSIRSGKHVNHPKVSLISGVKHVEIDADQKMINDVESLYVMYTPFSIDFIPDAYSIIADPLFVEEQKNRKDLVD